MCGGMTNIACSRRAECHARFEHEIVVMIASLSMSDVMCCIILPYFVILR